MRLFKRGTAAPEDERAGDLLDEIRHLTADNRERRDPAVERRLLRLRHLAGIRLLGGDGGERAYPEPDFAGLPDGDPLPELAPADVTPELLRAAILRDGCLLVRGLVDRDDALRLADGIERAFAGRAALRAGESPTGEYEEFEPEPGFELASTRPWIEDGGGVLAIDAPALSFEMLREFDEAGVLRLVAGYLGEPPLLSFHKTTLRKVMPSLGGAWHQDGAFMGDVRALNLWLALSRCGDEAPGLDVVPRRLDEVVVAHDEMLDVELTRRRARVAAGDAGIVRPIFEAGDALFFDGLFLHQTASDPSMPKPRFAIESWFFGGTGFPAEYAPMAA
jgi:hypothetical protein